MPGHDRPEYAHANGTVYVNPHAVIVERQITRAIAVVEFPKKFDEARRKVIALVEHSPKARIGHRCKVRLKQIARLKPIEPKVIDQIRKGIQAVPVP